MRGVLLTALVLARRLKVLEKGCGLGKKHGRKQHDAQAYAHSALHTPQVERPIIVVGTCSPVDRIYVAAMPAIATSAMAENHIKTDSIGGQLQAECGYEQEGLPKAWSSPPFLSAIAAQLCHVAFLTAKSAIRQNQENRGLTGSLLGQGSVGTRGGGGYGEY